MKTAETLAKDCDVYLSQRTANYEQRAQRYAACFHTIEMHGGLANDDILLDLGAGGTDLDYWLRTAVGWRGRYWPIDGWQGVDLSRYWQPARSVAWTVMLEFIEHVPFISATQLLESAKGWSTKGVMLSTPNADTVDVLEMDDTHLWGAREHDLQRHGFETLVTSLYGRPEDSIVAWWTRG